MPDQTENYDIGMLVLVSNAHFKSAGYLLLARVWLLGRHQKFTHLGMRARIAFYQDVPYLLTFRPVAA